MRPRGTAQRPRCQPGTDAPHPRPHTTTPRPAIPRRPTRTHALLDDNTAEVEAQPTQSQATRPGLYRVPSSLTSRADADAMEHIATQARAELALLLDMLPANARQALQRTLDEDDDAGVRCRWSLQPVFPHTPHTHTPPTQLLEVVLDLGRPPIARFPSGDVQLDPVPITRADLQGVTGQVGVFGGDNRAGIDRTLHRISCIRNRDGSVVGLTCRVGRAVPGAAVMVADLVEQGRSILLLGTWRGVCV